MLEVATMGKTQFMTKLSLRKSKEGALEGLPLYMVILVVIVTCIFKKVSVIYT